MLADLIFFKNDHDLIQTLHPTKATLSATEGLPYPLQSSPFIDVRAEEGPALPDIQPKRHFWKNSQMSIFLAAWRHLRKM